LVPPGLTVTRVPGLSISASVSYLFLSARDRRLALAHDPCREESLLLPVQRNRYAAHRDVEIVGLKILHQLRPGGLDAC
jgi:hypothetical protein